MQNNSAYGQSQPVQKLSKSKKNKKWREANVDHFIGRLDLGSTSSGAIREKMRILYDLYNSIFDKNDFMHITDPYHVNDSFPATLQNFNIIKPKIDLLLGEESKRPFSFKVVQVNQEATSELEEKQMAKLREAILDIASSGDLSQPVEEDQVNELANYADYLERDFTDTVENIAYSSLKYLIEKEDLKDKFITGFRDVLTVNREVYYTGVRGGEPVCERVNPMEFSCDQSPEVNYIEDGDWAVRKMKMTPSAIYDRFYDIMDESDLDNMLKLSDSQYAMDKKGDIEKPYIMWRNIETMASSTYNQFESTGMLDVYHVTWKSLKKIGFLSYFDEDGEEQQIVVDEDYEVDEMIESIEWDWVTEVWEGYKIGDGLYLGIGPIPNQIVSIDTPNASRLPYIGMIVNDISMSTKSLVEAMKPLQYMYVVIWYRLELALSRDKGRIINMDITQIPKSMNVDVNKWMHYLSSLGVNFFNPYEEGWDIPGREGGKPSSFNQFSDMDLSMSKVISDYIGLMDKIEEMAGELSGVSRQRQGAISSNELVGSVERAVVQSSHITEMLFWKHNQVKKRVLISILEAAKSAWKNSNKKKLHYIAEDTSRKLLDITDDFLYSDMGIFVTDSTKENQNIEMLKQLYQPAMQNGASLGDIASIMVSDNLTDIRSKLNKIEKEKQQREDQIQQQQAESQQQLAQMQAQAEEARMELEREKMEIEMAKAELASETAIQVAMINAESKQNADQVKLNKDISDSNLKREELLEKMRSNREKERLTENAQHLKNKNTQ